jgi:hypothetical protein
MFRLKQFTPATDSYQSYDAAHEATSEMKQSFAKTRKSTEITAKERN